MTHLTNAQLHEWHVSGRGGDVVIAHLAECDACGARLAALVRDEPIDGDASLPDARLHAPRGYTAYRSRNRAPWRAVAAAAAVAAAIVVAVVVPSRLGVNRKPLQQPGGSVTRGATIRALGPIDSAPRPLTFSWSSPVRAASYRVEIVENSTAVLSASASGDSLTLAPDVASRLQADRLYRWRVVALAADGEVLAASDWTGFRLTR